MQRLYEDEGLSIRQIGVKLARSMGLVHRHLRALEVEIRPSHVVPWPGNTLEHAEMQRTGDLYLSGLSAREVGAVVGRDCRTVLYRLERAGVPRRSKSEAMKGRARRTEHEDRILEVYAQGANLTETARVVGVTRQTVNNVLDRNGVEIRSRSEGVKRAAELRHAGTPPPPKPAPTGRAVRAVRMPQSAPVVERLPRIPARPLLRAIEATRPSLLAHGMPGMSPRLLWQWRRPGVRTDVDRADAVLLELGLLWWEVFDQAPGLFSSTRSRDVVAWLEAAMRASEVWGDG